MKPTTPPENIVIGILYFAGLVATIYLTKLVFKSPSSQAQNQKYTYANFKKGLNSPIIYSEIDPLPIVFKSYLQKYTFVGGFFNCEKLYLLKEVFIFSMVLVACISINTITLWPIGIAIFGAVFMIIAMEVFGIPLSYKNSIKVQEE